jgi:hypothetical protein
LWCAFFRARFIAGKFSLTSQTLEENSPRLGFLQRLAKRLEAGLEIMVNDGSLKAIFNATYGDALKIADLKSRKIIFIKNSSLPPLTPLDRKELWYDPFEEEFPPADSESSNSPAL